MDSETPSPFTHTSQKLHTRLTLAFASSKMLKITLVLGRIVQSWVKVTQG